MSLPFKPIDAVIKIGTLEIGAGVASAMDLTFSRDVDDYYGFGGGGDPTVVLPGHKHYTGRITKAYLDNEYGTLVVVNGATLVDIVFYPEGKVNGKPTITVKDCILSGWGMPSAEGDFVAENIEFRGSGLEFGTYTPP